MDLEEITGECQSYCPHGAKCRERPRHAGKHRDRACEWTDEEAISRAEANRLLMLRVGPEKAIEIIAQENIAIIMLGLGYDDGN